MSTWSMVDLVGQGQPTGGRQCRQRLSPTRTETGPGGLGLGGIENGLERRRGRPRAAPSGSGARADVRGVLVRMLLGVLRLRLLHDLERLLDGAAVGVGGALHVL